MQPSPQTSKRSVFISHASKNLKLADEIRIVLEEKGISCWIAPRDIPPGGSYGTEIINGISQCSVFLLLLTNESNLSTAVRNEVERAALGYHKIIVPVRISDIKPAQNIEFFVSNAQWVDAIHTPLRKRMDEVAAIVHAVETSSQIPTIPAEKRTIADSAEKFLERVFRHKTASLLAGFSAVMAMTALGIILQKQSVERVTLASKNIEQSSVKIDTAAASIQTTSNKVAALDSTLGALKKEVSDDPRKELISRGYTIDASGLMMAISQADIVALQHFNNINYVTQQPKVIKELFGRNWNPEVVKAISPTVLASVCSYVPVEMLTHPMDETGKGIEERHSAMLQGMVRICGVGKIRSALISFSERQKQLRDLPSSLGISQKDEIENARLKINPNKYSKAAQHQKSAAVEARELGQCGQPGWACTYSGEGLSPDEFKKFEQEKMKISSQENSEYAATQIQIEKYLANLESIK